MSFCKIENGSSKDLCCCPCESQPHESITAASDLSGSVAALIGSADAPVGNRHFNEIPEKSICTSLLCPFSVINYSTTGRGDLKHCFKMEIFEQMG